MTTTTAIASSPAPNFAIAMASGIDSRVLDLVIVVANVAAGVVVAVVVAVASDAAVVAEE